MSTMRAVTLILLACGIALGPALGPTSAFGSTRGSETDVADLAHDLGAFFIAQCRLGRLASDNRSQLSIERQREILGLEGSVDLQTLHERMKKFWKENIVDRSLRIATNPATPCPIAQLVLTSLFEAERQTQLLGLTGSDDSSPEMNLREPTSELSQALTAVKRRCLEQAFDACMESGNGAHILVMLAQAIRQFQLLSIEDPDFEGQGVYLFRRCTVYQLRFRSQARALATKAYAFGATYDGSTVLLADVDPAGGFAGLAGEHEWKGPRPGDPDDVIASVTECSSPARKTTMTCEAPQPKLPAQARIKGNDLSMKRYYDELEVSRPDCANDLAYLEFVRSGKGAGQITSTRKSDGNDALKLTYGPGLVLTFAKVSSREMTLTLPLPPSNTVFLTAHAGGKYTEQEVTLQGWTRGGQPVLFEKSVAGDATVDKTQCTDTTKFELVHRPDLFPAEEIVPRWELTSPQEPPQPPRKPLKPAGQP